LKKIIPVFLHGYSGDGKALQEFADLCFPGQKPICIDLPGFGDNPLQNGSAENNPLEYIEEIWKTVKKQVPKADIHLVGHSYGAVLAFALASKYDEVVRVDLFNPGLWPRLIPHMLLYYLSEKKYIPGGLGLATKIMKNQRLVDIATQSMQNKAWPANRQKQIKAMRRKESEVYSPQMLSLSLYALKMPKILKQTRCEVPVRIVHAKDDTVTRYISCTWLKERSKDCHIFVTYGGHLGLLAEPKRWSSILYDVIQ